MIPTKFNSEFTPEKKKNGLQMEKLVFQTIFSYSAMLLWG